MNFLRVSSAALSVAVILILKLCFCDGAEDFLADVEAPQRLEGIAGLNLKISYKAFNYLASILGDLISKMAKRFEIPDVKVVVEVLLFEVPVKLSAIKLEEVFHDAVGYSLRKFLLNKVQLSVKNVTFLLSGKGQGELLSFIDSGNFHATFAGLNFFTTLIVTSTIGHPHLTVEECEASVDSLTLKMTGMRRERLQYHINENPGIAYQVKSQLQRRLCQAFKETYVPKFNRLMLQSVVQVPLIPTTTTTNALSDLFNFPQLKSDMQKSFMGRQMMKILQSSTFDRRLALKPSFDHNQIDLSFKGEISWLGGGRTPFYPVNLKEIQDNSDKMLKVTMADYVLNSMLYNAFKANALSFQVDAVEAPELGKFLRASCDQAAGELCLGGAFPRFSRLFSNSSSFMPQLLFNASRAPALLISGTNETKLTLHADFGLKLMAAPVVNDGEAKKQQQQPLELIYVEGAVRLDVSPKLVNGVLHASRAKFKKFDMRLVRSLSDTGASAVDHNKINQDRQKVDDLARSASTQIETTLNTVFEKGLRLPHSELVGLENCKLKWYWSGRRLRLEADFHSDSNALFRWLRAYWIEYKADNVHRRRQI